MTFLIRQMSFTLVATLSVAIGNGLIAQEVEDASKVDVKPYVEALKRHGQPAIEYIVEKCRRHDLVLVGEEHGIRENCEFIAEAIEPLYRQAKVRVLATEFLRSTNVDRVKQLVCGSEFDRELALTLMRDNAWPTWGYEEYLEILKAVWWLNASLPEGAERMRVVPLDSEWSQHDLFYKQISPQQRFNIMRRREQHMVGVLQDEVISPGNKAIAHVGFQHSLLTQGERVGTVLHREYKNRVSQVCLHHKFAGPRGPSTVARLIDRAFENNGTGPIGFDIANTPFAKLRDPSSPAFTFGGDRGLDELAVGYIVLDPLDNLRPVRWIDGFITEDTFREALEVAVKMGQADAMRDNTPAKLNARMKQVLESRMPQ